MTLERAKKEIMSEEGFSSHAYGDHLGYLTIGYGRMVDKRKGGGISEEEAAQLLLNDIYKINIQLADNIPFWHGLNDVRKACLINMAYQLGLNGLLGFKKMLKAMHQGKWGDAYVEGLDSLWAKQTPQRANRIMTRIRDGHDTRNA